MPVDPLEGATASLRTVSMLHIRSARAAEAIGRSPEGGTLGLGTLRVARRQRCHISSSRLRNGCDSRA